MSIVRAVLRQCVVAALRENTWADTRVYDSDSRPLIEALTIGDKAKPYIVVFTDTDNMTDVTDGLYSSTRQLQLTLEMGVAAAVRVATETDPALQFPYTDEAMELLLDVMETQALAAIHGDPRSEWGEIARQLILKIHRVNSPRGGRTEKGMRYAARQVTLVLDVVSDPPPGVILAATHPIKQFIDLAQLKNTAGIGDAAEIINSVLESTAYPSWQQAQAWLGLTKRAVRGIGIAPLAVTSNGTTPWATEMGESATEENGEPPETEKISMEDIPPSDTETDVVPPPSPPRSARSA